MAEHQGPNLAGSVALVTGAARGLGEAYARALHAAGASVMIADILEEQGLALAEELGERARFAHLDVTDEQAWDQLVEETVADWGKLDVLVNNAGIANSAPIECGSARHRVAQGWSSIAALGGLQHPDVHRGHCGEYRRTVGVQLGQDLVGVKCGKQND